ncbi:hypothetical protein M758_8G168700 [Ceratodon purpureus]|nr:hypothetical protein M758_8G168700 [Ceratodon purpureus]
MSVAVLGRDWDMIPSSSSHEQQQQTQQQQQEKKASQLFAQRALQERRLKPPDQVIACPRCQSLNTKFCYYNNYSLTQPRHFCKSCRRYWTAGGTLRNVPVGGGCRKNKRTKPRTPEASNSGAGSDSGGSLSVPGLQHPGFSSASVGFLSSSEGGSPYGLAEPSMRADSSMSQSGEGGQLIPFHPGQSSGLAQHHPHSHPHAFDGGLAQLNFFRNHSRPEGTSNLHPGFQMPGPGDLSEIFDTSTVARVGALATLNEGLGTFNLNPEAGGRDNQQPSFVSLERWQAAKQQQHVSQAGGMRESEVAAAQAGMDMNRQDVKGKMTLSMVPVPGMDGRGQQRGGAPSWQLPSTTQDQSNPALHYQQTPEHNYWSNAGWPSMDSQSFQSSGGGQAL